jgi:transcriptional regulator with XRE-family HTH domain
MNLDFRKLRKEAKLTLKEVAARTGWSIATISGFETNGEGGPQFRKKLLAVYGLSGGDVDAGPDSESETEAWRLRARIAEQRLSDLRRGLRALLDSDSNSKLDEIAEDNISAQAHRIHSRRKVPVGSPAPEPPA